MYSVGAVQYKQTIKVIINYTNRNLKPCQHVLCTRYAGTGTVYVQETVIVSNNKTARAHEPAPSNHT